MTELRPYQLEAVERAMAYSGFGLFMEQRTGKTKVALEITRRRQPARCLIVCPELAIDLVWKPETATYPGLEGIEFRIVTFAYACRNRKKLIRWAADMVICDEAHMIKNQHTSQSRAIRAIGRRADYRLALSGTPISEGLKYAWAQFDFMDSKVFGKWSQFKSRYLIYGGFMGKKVVGYKNQGEFKRRFHDRTFRVLLDEVQDEPTKVLPRVLRFPLTDSALAYQTLNDRYVASLTSGERIPVPLAISRAQKLQQIASGFIRDADGNEVHTGYEKLERLGVLLLRYQPEPIVVFARFLRNIQQIVRLCCELGIEVQTIQGGSRFDRFERGVVVVQIQKGLAIDLSIAKHAVFYTWNHSHAQHEQAKFRVRHFGAKEVRYTYLVAKDTVDEDLYLSSIGKGKFSTMVLDRWRKRNGSQEKSNEGFRRV